MDFVPALPEVRIMCLILRLLNICRYFGIMISDIRTCFFWCVIDNLYSFILMLAMT